MLNRSKLFSALLIGLVIAGCGGGGGADASAPTGSVPSPSPTSPPVATTKSVFSDPVPMTCEVKLGEKTCNAPTSSFGGSELIQAALTDPLAGTMTIKSFGYAWQSYSRVESIGGTSTPTKGSMTYDGSDEDLKLSVGSIEFQGNRYIFSKTYPFAGGLTGRSYCKTPKDCIHTVPNAVYEWQPAAGYGKLVDLHKTQTDGTIATGAGGSTIIESSGSEWDTYIGLLSDRQSVVLPANDRITYTGVVYVIAGDGSPLGNGFSGGVTGCPIELTLNTTNGDITTTGATCIAADGASLDFSLKDIVLDKSKVRPVLLADGAQASGFVMSLVKEPNRKTPFTFTSSKISGGVYGRNAETLSIFGSGSAGVFKIVGNRPR